MKSAQLLACVVYITAVGQVVLAQKSSRDILSSAHSKTPPGPLAKYMRHASPPRPTCTRTEIFLTPLNLVGACRVR